MSHLIVLILCSRSCFQPSTHHISLNAYGFNLEILLFCPICIKTHSAFHFLIFSKLFFSIFLSFGIHIYKETVYTTCNLATECNVNTHFPLEYWFEMDQFGINVKYYSRD